MATYTWAVTFSWSGYQYSSEQSRLDGRCRKKNNGAYMFTTIASLTVWGMEVRLCAAWTTAVDLLKESGLDIVLHGNG